MKKVNKKVEDYEQALDAYLFYDKKALDEEGIRELYLQDYQKETAKKMLEDNMSIELIMKYTGLTKDEIEAIQKEENESEKSEE